MVGAVVTALSVHHAEGTGQRDDLVAQPGVVEVVEQLLTRRPARSALTRLSPRELEVLALMAEGLGNAAIGRSLVVTDGAVHKHIRSIFAKLDLAPDDQADRRVVAVLRYLNEGAR